MKKKTQQPVKKTIQIHSGPDTPELNIPQLNI